MLEDLTGQVLGPYRLEELIGRGGMATVYRAHQTSMHRDVAIKVMAPHLAANPEFVARFEREARVIARLQHPHILPVFDFGRTDDGYIYLVMRLVEGGVLSDKLRQPLTLQQVARFLGQIAEALEYAHKQGVIHRDLKPTNVLLDEEDNVYLTDFGIAKMIAGTTTGMSLTATGHVMGTPAYMAPEQWRSEPVDARTDIYALGVMLYEMLLGALPFQSDTPFGLMYKHFDQAPPPPCVLNPELPPAVERIVLRALAKPPEARYASAQQMAAEFKEALRALPAERLVAPLPRVTQEQVERATPPAGSTGATVAPDAPTVPPPTVAGDVPPPTDFVPPEAATGYQPATPAASATRSRPVEPSRSGAGRSALYTLAALLLIAVVGGGVLWWWNGREAAQPTPSLARTATVAPTTAPALVLLASPSATETHRGGGAGVATVTGSTAPNGDAAETAQALRVVSRTAAAWTDTPTPDLAATAEAVLAERLTRTAAAWTDTPTLDMRATVDAALTGTASRWTDTPTASATRTPRPTATPTRVPNLPPPPTATRTRTPSYTPRPTSTPRATATSARCGSLPARMRVGEGGRTTLDPPLPTALRAAPSLDAAIVHTLPPGQTFMVWDGPECADGVRWWHVEGMDAGGVWEGWIGEGQEGMYWIEPFDVGAVECPGAPLPRLIIGETGRITLDPPVPSRVRSDPRVEPDNIIGRMEPGEVFIVRSGPVCDEAHGWRWWLVENERVSGWVAEGPRGEYWMEPLP